MLIISIEAQSDFTRLGHTLIPESINCLGGLLKSHLSLDPRIIHHLIGLNAQLDLLKGLLKVPELSNKGLSLNRVNNCLIDQILKICRRETNGQLSNALQVQIPNIFNILEKVL